MILREVICAFMTMVLSVCSVENVNNTQPNNMQDNNLSGYVYCVKARNDSDYPEGWIDEFNSNIYELQNIFINGKYWNHMVSDEEILKNAIRDKVLSGEISDDGEYRITESSPEKDTIISYMSVTDIPCNHPLYGEEFCNVYNGKSTEAYHYESISNQCWGFASLLSDLIFGVDAPIYRFTEYDKLRVGDQARILNDNHTVFIIDKTDEYVIVAECNEDYDTCKIRWGRKIMRKDLDGWNITRWEWL